MPTETQISTPLPQGADPATIVSRLHNHDLYIRTTCPQLISYKAVSSSEGSSSSAAVYEVTDKRPIGQTTYTLTLTNQPDGLDGRVDGKAPTGAAIVIKTEWRVKGGKLEEKVDIDSNMLMRGMIKGSVEKSHPEHHARFVGEGAEGVAA